MRILSLIGCVLVLASHTAIARKAGIDKPDSLKNTPLSGLKFRSIGPGVTGGRIVDFAVHPTDPSSYFVASGHGSLWKTNNHGTTFIPAFEGQGSFAIGAVEYDPGNPHVVWVGTGEHNNQSNVIYGDGVYRSEDGGQSWKNMGLKNSEHIGGIVIHPENSNIVYVAAYGSTRTPNKDRGVYKSSDGGKSWEQVLFVNDHTGCFEIHMDPKNPNILYASMHQRMRADYTVLRGGPETAIYRTMDGGTNWEKCMKGISAVNKGRIGLSVSPANPNVVYACVEAAEGGGLYRSSNQGGSWEKQSDYSTAYPFYMQKIVADPKDENTLYGMDLKIQISVDGGKSFRELGEKFKHVDNHALWIDPSDTRHLLSGCDGGVYESWDRGQNWDFKANLPITEIYKISTDNALPFYNVYIGTQDNLSLVGPSQTTNSSGITNADWTFTKPGDGFESQADWSDDNIVYAQSQFGNLVRYNKKTGERLDIQPEHELDSAYRFDWDSPLLISKHNPAHLYFAANVLFKTEDRGNSWQVISPDLTRGVPKEMLKIAGKSWSIDDMISKGSPASVSTIAESALDENVLYVGTADGLIHYTVDGGKTWNRSALPDFIKSGTRVHHIIASVHQVKVAYAACQAMNSGDYRPMLLKTIDGGKSWQTISSNLPKRGSTYCIAEDHVNPELLFAGTQFGLYMTVSGGSEWIRFMNGLPTTTIMDMEIQKRESDLVVSTFGRGVYILDDYTPLRELTNERIKEDFLLFPIADAHRYVEANPFGYKGVGFQGASYYSAPNPEQGAVFTWYIKDAYKSLKDIRREKEKKIQEQGGTITYPDYQTLLDEQNEMKPYLLFTISGEDGEIVRKMKKDISKGVQRITWDLRYDAFGPIKSPTEEPRGIGYLVAPGNYFLSVHRFDGTQFKELASGKAFRCVPLHNIQNSSDTALTRFNRKAAELLRVAGGAEQYRLDMEKDVQIIEKAMLHSPRIPLESELKLQSIHKSLKELDVRMNGDKIRSRYEGGSSPTMRGRIENLTWGLWSTTSAPTETYIRSYEIARSNVEEILTTIQKIDSDIQEIKSTLEAAKVPYTPGRIPQFKE